MRILNQLGFVLKLTADIDEDFLVENDQSMRIDGIFKKSLKTKQPIFFLKVNAKCVHMYRGGRSLGWGRDKLILFTLSKQIAYN